MTVDLSTIKPEQVIFFVLPDWLRKPLKVSAETYQRGAIFIAQESSPRDYFLFGVLETMRSVGYTLLMIQRNLAGVALEEVERDLSASASSGDAAQARAFVDYFVRSKLVCMRQLVELLVDLLCFCEANEEPYYKQYMLVEGLSQARRVQQDWRTYYECQNRMMATVVESLEEERVRVAADCDEDRCWFGGKSGRPTSVASRFKKAMRVATPEERVSLGSSYNVSYGLGSRAVHIGVGAMQSEPVDVMAIDGYQRFIERLGLLILSRNCLALRVGNGRSAVDSLVE